MQTTQHGKSSLSARNTVSDPTPESSGRFAEHANNPCSPDSHPEFEFHLRCWSPLASDAVERIAKVLILEVPMMTDNVPRNITNLAKSDNLEVSVRIGRGGVTESLISELADQLSLKRLVKVKANKGTSSDREQRRLLFSEIAQLTTSIVVFQRGNVAVLWSGK